MDSKETQLQAQQQQQQLHAPAFNFNLNNQFMRDAPTSTPAPLITMNGHEMPGKTEGMVGPTGMWTTPTSQGMRPRPATIHEGFSYCLGEDYSTIPSWETSSIAMTPSDTMSRPVSMHQDLSRPVSMHQDFYPVTTMESNPWGMKSCEDSMENHGLDTEMGIGQALTTDDAIPILDLRYQRGPMEQEGGGLNFETGLTHRRMSGSSFTMSTSGNLSDMPSYDEFSSALSEAPSFSDYPPTSNRNSMMSSTQLSPVASPRMTPQSRSELVRTQSRGRGASPSPRPGGVRSAPYTVDSSARNKRWSTGNYGTTPSRRPSPFVYHHSHDPFGAARMTSRHSSPTISGNPLPLNFGNLQAIQHVQQIQQQHQPFLVSHAPAFRNSMLLPSQLPSQVPSNGFHHPELHHHFETPPPLMSHGLFRMLQSNADPHSLHGHYTDLSDPPDLFASLHEEQIPPPPEDMNPEDPDMVPHEQELRFEGDLYTPRWVRGHGNKREGWCGICKPGRWLVLKNSAFWYDKSFTHGISAATGNPFQEPQETRRMDGNPDVWEGLCGSCNDWIALVSSKKKGTTWFRHAYKCHTHPKIKDAPKRRRESSHSRALAASQMARPKVEVQRPDNDDTPDTPQGTTASMAVTPTPMPALPMTTMTTPQPLQQQQHQHHHQQQPQVIEPQFDSLNMI